MRLGISDLTLLRGFAGLRRASALRGALAVVLLSSVANADVGIPMLAAMWPIFWLAIVPVILLENWFLAAGLGVSYGSTVWVTAKANCLSTGLGIPIAWILMFVLQGGFQYVFPADSELGSSALRSTLIGRFSPFGSAWIRTGQGGAYEAAFLALAVPFFLASSAVELAYLRTRFSGHDEFSVLLSSVLKGNAVSYLALCSPVVYSLCL